jgi:hypothetical protein
MKGTLCKSGNSLRAVRLSVIAEKTVKRIVQNKKLSTNLMKGKLQ